MTNIKSFEFCFENCETVIIPFEYIATFSIGDITESINMHSKSAGVERRHTAASLYIRFHKTFNKAHIQTTCGTNAYDRLIQHNDICYLTITDEDNITRTFGIQWPNSEDNEWNNPRQTTRTTFGDALEIMVDKE